MRILRDLISCIDGIRCNGNTDIPIKTICTNSKKVQPDSLFVAVRGTRMDGHNFIEEAVKNGATAVVCEDPPPKRLPATTVIVPDSAKALALLSAAFHSFPTKNMKLIGITGTNGKTTTAILIEQMLQSWAINTGRIGTLGYCWNHRSIKASLTTPDPVILQEIFSKMKNDGVEAVVMEVSSHALAQNRIHGCLYDLCLFTNLSQDHLDYHKTMEDYFTAKEQLFLEHLKPGRWAVVNADDPYGKRLIEDLRNLNIKVISYGIDSKVADVKVTAMDCSTSGLEMEIETLRPIPQKIYINSSLLGSLNAYNILASVAAGVVLGIPRETIAEGVRKVTKVEGRLEPVPIPADFNLIVDYAHTPDAMEKVLQCLREWTEGKLIVVFGCGGDRDPTKRPLMAQAATRFGDVVIITSDNPRTEDPQQIIDHIVAGMPSHWKYVDPERIVIQGRKSSYTVIPDRKEAIRLALTIAERNDTVFLGGKGHETYQIIGTQHYPFDDRKVALECFREINNLSSSLRL